MQKPKFMFYPNTAKKSRKTHLTPIYLRVSKGNSKREAKLDVTLQEDEVVLWNGFTQRLQLPNHPVNAALETIAEKFRVLEFGSKEKFFSMKPEEIKKRILGLDTQPSNNSTPLILYLNNHIEESIKNNSKYSNGTVKNYKKVITHFIDFLKYRQCENITVGEFNTTLAIAFFDYLQQDILELGKESVSPVTASYYITKIKAIFQKALEAEIINVNPFRKLKLIKQSPKKTPLTIMEVREIKNLDLSNDPKLEVYRDLFLFCIYTGLAYGDVYTLMKSDFRTALDGSMIIHKGRNKTTVPYKQVLVEQAAELIKKYESHIEVAAFEGAFPKRHLNNVNDALKIIQLRAGITTRLSTHIARHSSCQMLFEIGTINSDSIDAFMGWSKNRQGSRRFYYSVTETMLLRTKQEYENFLKTHLTKN